jgi:hypothetical protein
MLKINSNSGLDPSTSSLELNDRFDNQCFTHPPLSPSHSINKSQTLTHFNDAPNGCRGTTIIGKVRNFSEIRGPVGIKELSLDSKCMVITNMSECNQFDLKNWLIMRRIDDALTSEIVYAMPEGTIIGAKSRLNIWSNDYYENKKSKGIIKIRDSKSETNNYESDDHQATDDSSNETNIYINLINTRLSDWGDGNFIQFKLYDAQSNIRSVYTRNVINDK